MVDCLQEIQVQVMFDDGQGKVGMLHHMFLQISCDGCFITALCTFAYFTSNRIDETWMFLYYMIVQ
nr:unnamed protein product [Callosobruchus analis]